MRPFDILDLTPKAPKPASHKATWRDLAGMIGLILLAWAVMGLTACDMAAQQITAADSTRAADSTGAPSKQLLGAWKSTDTTGIDSLWGIAFLPSGRFVKAIPACDGPDSCWAEYLGGTWAAGASSIALTVDSSGVPCDSTICWYDTDRRTQTSAYLLRGDTLSIGSLIYSRIH